MDCVICIYSILLLDIGIWVDSIVVDSSVVVDVKKSNVILSVDVVGMVESV